MFFQNAKAGIPIKFCEEENGKSIMYNQSIDTQILILKNILRKNFLSMKITLNMVLVNR